LGIGLLFSCISIKLFGTAGTFPALVGLLVSGALPSAGLGLLIRRPIICAICGGVLFALAIIALARYVGATVVLRGDPSNGEKSLAAAPDAKAPANSGALITISRKTSFITEPVRKDGYVNYIAALNERACKGVTPENNASALVWTAFGPESIDLEQRDEYFRLLRIRPLPIHGDYFVGLSSFPRQSKEYVTPGSVRSAQSVPDAAWDQFEVARNRPWSRSEFPQLAGWLSANEKPLAIVLEASKRPRRYDPQIPDRNGTILSIKFPALMAYRDAAWALEVRATLRVGEGKFYDAWEDLLAIHRLARLAGQGPTLVDGLVPVGIDWIARSGDQVLLQREKLTPNQLLRMRGDLEQLPPLPKLAEKVDFAERFVFLDSASTLAREGEDGLRKLSASPVPLAPLTIPEAQRTGWSHMDWDLVLRLGNSWYDRMAEAFRQPTRADRQRAFRQIDQDLKEQAKSLKDIGELASAMAINPQAAVSVRIEKILICLQLPAVSAASNAEDRGATVFESIKVGFALAAYRADHGSYPARLAELIPKYFAVHPKDIFSGGELHYRQQGSGYLLFSVGPNGRDDGGKGDDDRIKEHKEHEGWDDLAIRVPADR
jgi:hypothetical protein